MNWQQHFCPNQRCSIDGWMAQRSPGNQALWQLADRFGGAFTIAAVQPVCPRCGTTLCPTIEQAQGIGGSILEEGPVLEFVRGLSYSAEHSS
jgi:hypothetical protein